MTLTGGGQSVAEDTVWALRIVLPDLPGAAADLDRSGRRKCPASAAGLFDKSLVA